MTIQQTDNLRSKGLMTRAVYQAITKRLAKLVDTQVARYNSVTKDKIDYGKHKDNVI